MTDDNRLRLLALDAEDLEVLAVHLQDAVVKVSDIAWKPQAQQAILVFNRFAWEAGESGRLRSRQWQRRRAVLHFDRVTAMRSIGLDRNRPDDVLSLLTIAFVPGEEPGGRIDLIFAGDIGLQLDVECIEAQLTDLGAAWATRNRPRHGTG